MLHVSTRGEAPALGFADALLAGLARDGGLYMPQAWPTLTSEAIADLAGLSYAEVARRIIGPFLDGEIDTAAFSAMVDEAYASFRHPAVCPLVQIGDNLFVLELFHGPTLAFKDVAMQLLGRLMDHVLEKRGQRATIVGATSGDTGGAAIEAFRGLKRVDMFILYPQGRVSEVQRRQMTTVADENVHAIAVEGDFDDCQALVKAMFNHHAFRDEMGLSGVNSINWARIVAQVVYYFTAAVSLGGPHRPVSFSVPTGNFGDVLAGLGRQADGPADGPAQRGDEHERHPGAHPRNRSLRDHRRGADVLALHGHPGVLELRTAAVRGARQGWRGGAAHDGLAVAEQVLLHRGRPHGGAPARFQRQRGAGGCRRSRDGSDMARRRLSARPAHRHRRGQRAWRAQG